MFWQDDEDTHDEYRVPDDVFDLVFKIRGNRLEIDHAGALATALRVHLDEDICRRIGVHGVSMPGSGNGWQRPEQGDATLPLSRRARLAVRVHREDGDIVRQITDRKLQIGAYEVTIGESSIRKLSTIGTLHARAVSCDCNQSEAEFMNRVATQLQQMNIRVKKMLCGKSSAIRTEAETVFARSLLVAELEPEASVTLQRQGLGEDRLLGCGLFVPHKSIEPVYNMQESY